MSTDESAERAVLAAFARIFWDETIMQVKREIEAEEKAGEPQLGGET